MQNDAQNVHVINDELMGELIDVRHRSFHVLFLHLRILRTLVQNRWHSFIVLICAMKFDARKEHGVETKCRVATRRIGQYSNDMWQVRVGDTYEYFD